MSESPHAGRSGSGPSDSIGAGSDPKMGVVYVGTAHDLTRLTLRQAREFIADLLWHMDRAARGDEPEEGWPEDIAASRREDAP